MESISDVVDEVIQNCPIDVRRPLYKVWPLCSKISWILLEDNCYRYVAFVYGTLGYDFPYYEKCELLNRNKV